jgi:hypothetical protein
VVLQQRVPVRDVGRDSVFYEFMTRDVGRILEKVFFLSKYGFFHLKYGSTRGRGGTEAMANAKQGEASGDGEGREGGGRMQVATHHVTLG